MKPMLPKRRALLSAALYVLIAIFVGRFLTTVDYGRLSRLSITYWSVLLASVIALGFRYWGAFIWRTILVALGARDLPSFSTLSLVYAKAWLGRYIPGTVPWIAGKVFLASSHGISRKRLVIASILEGAIQVVAIFAISLVFLGLDERLDVIPTPARLSLLAIGVGTTVVLIPPIFNSLMRQLVRLTGREIDAAELTTNSRTVVSALGLYGVGYFITGASQFFLARSIFPLGFDDFFYTVAAFNIAGAIGMASIVTPSGLGVREGVLLVLLPVIMPREAALVLTAASRLWSLAVDLLFFGIAQAVHRVRVPTAERVDRRR